MSAHEPAGAAGDWCLERGSADGQCGSPVPAHRGRPYGIATLRNGFSWIFMDFNGFYFGSMAFFNTFLIFIWCDFSESVQLGIVDYGGLMDFNGF